MLYELYVQVAEVHACPAMFPGVSLTDATEHDKSSKTHPLKLAPEQLDASSTARKLHLVNAQLPKLT